MIIPKRKKNKILIPSFTNTNVGGPLRFLNNLRNGLKNKNWDTTPFSLSTSNSVLLISNSPGDYFYKICKLKKIFTVLRVDGFYLPTIFNNEKYKYRSLRILDEEKIEINQRLQKDIYKADWVIYQSEYSKNNSDKYLYNRNNNFRIIHNGVDTNLFFPNSNNNKSYKLMMLGTWRDSDLFFCSLNAFLYANNNVECSLTIIGSMSKEVEKVYHNWIQNNEVISKRVNWVGEASINDLPDLIRECSISIHIKSGDSCPNAVLESMACGVPVICQSNGGTKELVGDSGIIIDHKEFTYDDDLSKKTSNAVIKMIEKRNEYSKSARNRVVNFFNIEIMIEKYLDILKKQEKKNNNLN